jgi:hypothetical protein
MCGSRVERLVTEKLFIHMTAHESLLCHLKPNSHMLIDGLLPLGWMKKTSINPLKIIVQF